MIRVTSASTSAPLTGLISMPSFAARPGRPRPAPSRRRRGAASRAARAEPGRRHERARHPEFGEHDLHHLAVLRRLRKFDRHRHALDVGVRLHAHLHQDVDLLVADPLRPRRGERGPVLAGLALHLAVLDREIDLGRAGIAVHDLEFRAQKIVAQHRQHIAVGAGRAGAENGLSRIASCSVFTGEVCHVTVTNTVCVMLPIQPNFVESNSALLPPGDSM